MIGSRDLIVVDTVVDAASIHGLALRIDFFTRSQWGIYVRVNELFFSYLTFWSYKVRLMTMWMTKGREGMCTHALPEQHSQEIIRISAMDYRGP